MNTKSIITSIISIIIFSLLFGYTLVYAWTWMFNNNTKIVFKLSENVFLDSSSLNKTELMFNSWNDLTKYKIKSECDIFSQIKYKKWDYYLFEIKFFNNKCDNNNLVLVNEKNEIEKSFTLNIVKEYNALSNLLDMKTSKLVSFQNTLNKKVKLYSKFEEYNPVIEENYYKFLEKNRILNESIYNADLVNNIIKKRNEKYIIPVEWKVVSTKLNKIPNAWRPYREDYTDGIHHGWDIDANVWETVLALDDSIVIRVVDGFTFSDLNKIKYWENLTYLEKLWNLDTLRWNQVWLKTMKWDVAFYSHLDQIFVNVKEWEVIKKWQPIWTVWITWVPDKDYTDSHLHLPIHMNPFDESKAWNYTYEDYMTWDWSFKWKSISYILENQSNIFE